MLERISERQRGQLRDSATCNAAWAKITSEMRNCWAPCRQIITAKQRHGINERKVKVAAVPAPQKRRNVRRAAARVECSLRYVSDNNVTASVLATRYVLGGRWLGSRVRNARQFCTIELG